MRTVIGSLVLASVWLLVGWWLALAATPEGVAPQALAWVLAPGDVRGHVVELELSTRLAVRSADEETVRQTSAQLSFDVGLCALRRRSADETVVELTVSRFRVGMVTKSGGSTVDVTIDDEGMTMRRGGETPVRTRWADAPRGGGREFGTLLGKPVLCTIDRHGGAAGAEERMRPWSQVLDSLDLVPLIMPLVPLPDTTVEGGSSWTVTTARTVPLSRPWGSAMLQARTEVRLAGFEQNGSSMAARLEFVRTDAIAEQDAPLSYELTIEGQVLVGLDGSVLGGDATITVAATASAADSTYELAGAGNLYFHPARPDAGNGQEPATQ